MFLEVCRSENRAGLAQSIKSMIPTLVSMLRLCKIFANIETNKLLYSHVKESAAPLDIPSPAPAPDHPRALLPGNERTPSLGRCCHWVYTSTKQDTQNPLRRWHASLDLGHLHRGDPNKTNLGNGLSPVCRTSVRDSLLWYWRCIPCTHMAKAFFPMTGTMERVLFYFASCARSESICHHNTFTATSWLEAFSTIRGQLYQWCATAWWTTTHIIEVGQDLVGTRVDVQHGHGRVRSGAIGNVRHQERRSNVRNDLLAGTSPTRLREGFVAHAAVWTIHIRTAIKSDCIESCKRGRATQCKEVQHRILAQFLMERLHQWHGAAMGDTASGCMVTRATSWCGLLVTIYIYIYIYVNK